MKKYNEEEEGMVRCKRCNQLKPRIEYRHDKIDYNCKSCLSILRTEKNRSIHGLALKMHTTQRRNSKMRNHPQPTYSPNELEQWLVNQPNFKALYDRWVKSDYDRQLVPSADRLDDSKGYSFDNIRLVSYRDNREAYSKQKIAGVAYKQDTKPIYQYDMTGTFIKEFYSITEAVRELGVISNAVSKVCQGRLNQHHGWIFKYKDEVPSKQFRLDVSHIKRKPNKRTL